MVGWRNHCIDCTTVFTCGFSLQFRRHSGTRTLEGSASSSQNSSTKPLPSCRERQLASLLPSKFVPYLSSPNATVFLQVGPLETRESELVVSATMDWMNTSYTANTMGEHMAPAAATPTTNNTEGWINEPDCEISLDQDQKLSIWLEDRLLNELLNQFKWDFEWLREDIPVESPKLPMQTREFLAALCNNCYFELHVSANGPPTVVSINGSIVLET